MFQKFDVISVHTSIDDRLQKYLTKKLANLDRYLPRKSRESSHAEVRLKEERNLKHANHKQGCTCEVTLHLPNEVINIQESMPNMYSAIDIVEAKLKTRITKYKERHAGGPLRRRLANRKTGSGKAQDQLLVEG